MNRKTLNKNYKEHDVCPNAFKGTPNVTGDYCLDGVIDLLAERIDHAKLNMHINTNQPYNPMSSLGRERN